MFQRCMGLRLMFDLEDALFENVDTLCQKIVNDIKTRFRRQLKYIEAECL